MTQLGDFQANVGKFSADIGLIISYIIAGILIIIGIVLAIIAFIPQKPGDCNKDDICKTLGKTSNDCKEETNRCNKKKPHYMLLWFLILIPTGIIIVLFSRWWKHYVHTNRTAAQVGGTLFEINTVRDLLGK